MNNIIRAELYRYKHSILFWLSLGAALIAGAVYGLDVINNSNFDDMFIVPIFIILAAFISLNIGREYADGTIRNKIIAGKTKATIFNARIVISLFVSTILVIAYLIPFIAISFNEVLTKFQVTTLLWILLGFILVNYVWAILFTVVSMLISSREIASIINFILVITIMFGAYEIENRLGQQPYIHNYSEETKAPMTPEEVAQLMNDTFSGSYFTTINDEGLVTYYKIVVDENAEVANPNYIGGPLRVVLQNVDYLLPYGQINAAVSYLTSLLYDVEEDEIPIKLYPLYSLLLLLALSVTGQIVFRKKDLK